MTPCRTKACCCGSAENRVRRCTLPPTADRVCVVRAASGHGGSDIRLCWRLIDCLHNGLPLDQDVYDAAAWSSIVPLSEWSVRNHSNSIDIPDFTAGAWETNKHNMDINLESGGNTKMSSRVDIIGA